MNHDTKLPSVCKLFFLLTVITIAFCKLCSPLQAMPQQKEYRDFRDIPGVTAQEIVAIEALQKKYSSLSYGMLNTTETFMCNDGQIGGYSAIFCNWMSNLFKIKFVPSIYKWNELIEGIEAGDIDFTGELTSTDERRKKYLMTDTFVERSVNAFRLRKSESLSDLSKIRKLRYAFLKGTTTYNDVIAVSPYPAEAVFVDNEYDAIAKLRSGEIDIFSAEKHGAAIFPDDIFCDTSFPVAYSPISFTTAKSELAPIISVFDKYLKNGAMYQLTDLYKKGDKEYIKHRFLTQLTDEERAYVEKHNSEATAVKVGAPFDLYPMSFYNVREQAWQGISIDLLNQITELSGLKFKIVNSTNTPWAEVFSLLERGDVAMVNELIYSEERKAKYLLSSEPYSIDYYALLSLIEHEDIGINQILYSKVGLIKRTAYADAFLTWFPYYKNVMWYDSIDEAFLALENKEIDLLMASRNMLLGATNYHENPSFKANFIFEHTLKSSFGFHKDEKVLFSIVEKSQSLIETRTITSHWIRKVFDYRSKMAREQVPYLIGISVLLLCVIVLLLVLYKKNYSMKAQLEVTVKERTAQLEIASKAKSDFLSRMSHEIRTPLNAIIGMAQVAQQSADDKEKNLRSIQAIISASSHLLGILNDVLDMSKIESGKFTLTEQKFMLSALAKSVENIIGVRCREGEITFVTNFSNIDDVAVVGDKLRLRQVLINLLGNAVKFTDKGGLIELSITVKPAENGTVDVSFIVKDNGIGMNEEQISRLFMAFEQADSTIAVRFGGTGLGLAISQNLVMQMGGEIKVQSILNEGSAFSFTVNLPITENFVKEEHKDAEQQLDLTGKRILLVEDIEINRLIIIELLGYTNVQIDEAEDGCKALQILQSAPEHYYDLIFMDIQMPGMDGYEVARQIRLLERSDAKTLPIIAMTANAYREDIDKALASGMNGHMAKPVELDALKHVLFEQLIKKV